MAIDLNDESWSYWVNAASWSQIEAALILSGIVPSRRYLAAWDDEKEDLASGNFSDSNMVGDPKTEIFLDLLRRRFGSEKTNPKECFLWARELRFLLKAIGLPEIRFHDLRASWATLLLGKGVAPSKVMSMGGWKDMDTMMIYMRKAGINIKDSTSVLDDLQTHGVEAGKLLTFK